MKCVYVCSIKKKKNYILQTIKMAKMYVFTVVFQNILQYKHIKTANQHKSTVATVATVNFIVIIFT